MTLSLIHQHTKQKEDRENDAFNEINDLFVGETREINPKYLGPKKTKKGFSERIESGYLYVLNARGTDLYKIGISSNVNRRVRDISASSPLPILICFTILIKEPNKNEAFLHKYYESRYFKNDWFSLNNEQFKELHSFFESWR